MTRRIFCLPFLAVLASCSDSTGPVDLTDGPSARVVAAGQAHTCALAMDGSAWCWGSNASGQLGDGTLEAHARPVKVVGAHTFESLAASGAPGLTSGHTCGVATDGSAYCWGANHDGQLGDGSRTSRLVPTRAGAALRFRSLTTGNGNTCGLSVDGDAYCWGANYYGQLGDGTTEHSVEPIRVDTPVRFVSLRVGEGDACGVSEEGYVYCWGAKRTGDGPPVAQPLPEALPTAERFESVELGGGGHMCGLRSDGTALCWGENRWAQLGDGSLESRTEPVEVDTPVRFAMLALSPLLSCGLSLDGAAYCWGQNAHGEVGDGTLTGRTRPVPVAGGLRFTFLALGSHHACGITAEHAVYCWGQNIHGELGDGSGSMGWTKPVPVRW